MIPKSPKFLFFLLLCLAVLNNHAAEPSKLSRTITVRDGLPQSYVSGIFQDGNGLLWISTLNGLGRFDGREFKRYQHTSSATAGISGSIILNLFDIGHNNLWLCYADGKIDKFNTITGKVEHLWKSKDFDLLKSETKYFRSLTRTGEIAWMMAADGGIYKIDLHKNSVDHFSPRDLKLQKSVVGLAAQNEKLLLLTQTDLNYCNDFGVITKTVPYPFKTLALNMPTLTDVFSSAVKANGELIIADAKGLKIWNPTTSVFKQILLTRTNGPGKLTARFDSEGNYYFEYAGAIYILQKDNSLLKWSDAEPASKGLPTSMFIDNSGVLWVGTNGFGLRQYNLKRTGLSGFENKYSFVMDVLLQYGISEAKIRNTFLSRSVTFANRIAAFKDSVWITDIYSGRINPELILFTNHQIVSKTFYNKDKNASKEIHEIKFLTTTPTGNLWGINQHYQLLKFDQLKLEFKLNSKVEIDPSEEVNGMVADGESIFYISTNKNLYQFNIANKVTKRLTGYLPSKDLLHICNDPDDKNILWIGTLADGMIKFNKNSKKVLTFGVANGLPNNTIYSILNGNDGLLWCSSNKGIFSFSRKDGTIRSFTSRDGLTDDEFNRFYYLSLPDGDLAFGGPQGYTIFNPLKLETDQFNPKVVLTGLNIINFNNTNKALSTLKELNLRYDQNFITAVFAAMQFDIPEKVQYRYLMKGLDKNWIMLDNENKASYTSLPSGSYTLLMNASNTAGKWSKYILQLKITIFPPFWKTWWFYLCAATVVLLIFYLILITRISSIKKSQLQKLQFERDAMELNAMALRARMNPHFIFNCMNSIKALIQEKHNKKAVDYLTTFATLIRKQLNNRSNEITLQDELETCRLYLELEVMRFDERINFNLQIADDEQLKQTKIPPLLLQPIVENAIVHGLLPAEQGGLVSIKVYRDGQFGVCEISDNGVGRAAAEINKQKSSRLHESKGIQLLEERITLHNRLNEQISTFETTDLFNPDGTASGTLVIIKFKMEI